MTFLVLVFVPVNFPYWEFAVVVALNGFGTGLFVSPNRAEMMNSVPANQRGAAGGMIATFMNSASVLSIGIFFSLMVAGLASKLPASMFSGLTAQGIPAPTATMISHLPPIGVLFAAFLGYNPMQQLLGPLLDHLPAAHAAYVVGGEFFPNLITGPFHDGLGVAFGFAIAACVIGAVASALTGRATARRQAESLGAELAAVAGEGTFEPAELVIPDRVGGLVGDGGQARHIWLKLHFNGTSGAARSRCWMRVLRSTTWFRRPGRQRRRRATCPAQDGPRHRACWPS